jgi:hypothetical protein
MSRLTLVFSLCLASLTFSTVAGAVPPCETFCCRGLCSATCAINGFPTTCGNAGLCKRSCPPPPAAAVNEQSASASTSEAKGGEAPTPPAKVERQGQGRQGRAARPVDASAPAHVSR